MEFANVGEFRQNAARVFEKLRSAGELVILRNGRPIGLLVSTDAATLDAFRVAAQRARAQLALGRVRRAAARRLDRLSPNAVDGLIRTTRRERTPRR
jgi:PHD/YefM family antitoxin component YafN of YafNO toxin-antitoxin module